MKIKLMRLLEVQEYQDLEIKMKITIQQKNKPQAHGQMEKQFIKEFILMMEN